MWWSRRSAALATVAALAGCGFRPLYRGHAPAAANLAAIAVDPIPERVGQLLRNALLDRLNPRGEPRRPRYRLAVTLRRTSTALAIQPDATTTRFNLRLDVRFTLTEAATGRTVYADHSRAIASFNQVRSDFATLAAEKDSDRRAAQAVSDEIATQLGVYFARREGG